MFNLRQRFRKYALIRENQPNSTFHTFRKTDQDSSSQVMHVFRPKRHINDSDSRSSIPRSYLSPSSFTASMSPCSHGRVEYADRSRAAVSNPSMHELVPPSNVHFDEHHDMFDEPEKEPPLPPLKHVIVRTPSPSAESSRTFTSTPDREFRKKKRKRKNSKDERQNLFRKMDIDDSGKITKREFKRACAENAVVMSRTDFRNVWNLLDPNKLGSISYRDFQKIIQANDTTPDEFFDIVEALKTVKEKGRALTKKIRQLNFELVNRDYKIKPVYTRLEAAANTVELFEAMDFHGKKNVTLDEWTYVLESCRIGRMTREEEESLFYAISETLNYFSLHQFIGHRATLTEFKDFCYKFKTQNFRTEKNLKLFK